MLNDLLAKFKKKDSAEEKSTSLVEEKTSKTNLMDDPNARMIVPGLLVLTIMSALGYFLLDPVFNEVTSLEAKLRDQNTKLNEIAARTGQVDIAKAKLEQLQVKSKQALRYFYTTAELDDLFKSLSEVAGRNSLKVISFAKKKPRPIYPEQKKRKKKPEPIYYEREILISLEGDFVSFLRFRNAIAKLDQIVDTAKEKIRLVELAEKPGSVSIELTLRTYSLEENS